MKLSIHYLASLAINVGLYHTVTSLHLPTAQHESSSAILESRDWEVRSVSWIADVIPAHTQYSPVTKQPAMLTESFLEISGTASEGPLHIRLITEKDPATGKAFTAIRTVDLGPQFSGDSIDMNGGPRSSKRYIYKLGETRSPNKAFVDPKTGNGLVLQAWKTVPSGGLNVPPLRVGGGDMAYNGEHAYIERFAKAIFSTSYEFPPGAWAKLLSAQEFGRMHGSLVVAPVRTMILDYGPRPAVLSGRETRVTWDITGEPKLLRPALLTFSPDPRPALPPSPPAPRNRQFRPLSSMDSMSSSDGEAAAGAAESPGKSGVMYSGDAVDVFDGIEMLLYEPINTATTDEGTLAVIAAGQALCKRGGSCSVPKTSRWSASKDIREQKVGLIVGGTDSAMDSNALMANGGKPGRYVPLQDMTIAEAASASEQMSLIKTASASRALVVKTVAIGLFKGALIVATIAAPVFIILDLVHGNYVGAIMGLLGVGAAILAGLLISGPVGWIVGGVAATFFAILPFLFQKKAKKPRRDNIEQIIQWVMFGDRDHTGNEKCREQGNPNCTAIYGPGIVSHAFEWENFDAFAFLIQNNAGYAMTIPDMAKSFRVVDPKAPAAGDQPAATIDCSASRKKKECERPKFLLNRALVHIPIINQTASQIYPHMIDNAGHGDCKLVSDPAGGTHYDIYNITVTGTPCAIACGIPDAALPGNSSVIATDHTIAPSNAPNLLNPANLDSSGRGGEAYVAAPPAQPFKTLAASDGLACLTSAKWGEGHTSFCLPNGTYHLQDDSWGFDIRDADDLTLPAAGNASLAWGKHHPLTADTNLKDHKAFHHDVHRYNPKKDEVSVAVPDQNPDVTCLFAEEEYKGNAMCFGAGGTDLPEQVRAKAKSMTVYGGINVWLYANHYGDDLGVQVSVDVPDLAQLTFGTNRTFSAVAVALWVQVVSQVNQTTQIPEVLPTDQTSQLSPVPLSLQPDPNPLTPLTLPTPTMLPIAAVRARSLRRRRQDRSQQRRSADGMIAEEYDPEDFPTIASNTTNPVATTTTTTTTPDPFCAPLRARSQERRSADGTLPESYDSEDFPTIATNTTTPDPSCGPLRARSEERRSADGMIAEVYDPEDFPVIAFNTTTPDSFSAPLDARSQERRSADGMIAEVYKPEHFPVIAFNTTTPDSFSAPLDARSQERRSADGMIAEEYDPED